MSTSHRHRANNFYRKLLRLLKSFYHITHDCFIQPGANWGKVILRMHVAESYFAYPIFFAYVRCCNSRRRGFMYWGSFKVCRARSTCVLDCPVCMPMTVIVDSWKCHRRTVTIGDVSFRSVKKGGINLADWTILKS